MATQGSDVTTTETEAETTTTTETVEQLKYLGFVKSFLTLIFTSALQLYAFLEQHSGYFKTLFSVIEEAESAFISPLLSKFAIVADHLLTLFDNRLVKAVELYKKVAPQSLQSGITEFTSLLKSAITESISLGEWATKATTTLVEKLKEGGIKGVISYILEQLYQLLAALYAKLLQILVSKITQMLLQALKIPSVQALITTAVPLATAAIDKYSKGITSALEGVATATTTATTAAALTTTATTTAAALTTTAADVAADVTDAAAQTVTSATTGVVSALADTLTEVASPLKG